MPVSDTSKATTLPAWLRTGWSAVQPAADGGDVQPHAALLRELEGVRQQVLEHLLQALRVGHDAAAETRVDLHVEGQPPAVGLVAERPSHHVQEIGEENLLGIHGDGARFDLREVEDVADQIQQVGPGAVNRAGELDLLAG